jgi:UDP-N-acetylglucosamine 2-epimerase (non-hydrolysing)
VELAVVVGTRPEIIKSCSVIREAFRTNCRVRIIHTGQHYDRKMSARFFQELGLPDPDVFLGVGSGTHGRQTGRALARVEDALISRRPDVVLVQGDTNSTLAGALAGVKLGIPVAHLEAGVRSFDLTMPEEVNRRLVDAVSSMCFAPTPRAMANLSVEGRESVSYLVGDTLVEVTLPSAELASARSEIFSKFGACPGEYALVTLHRSETVDSPARLEPIVQALTHLDIPVIYPVHPRAGKMLKRFGLLKSLAAGVTLTPPLGYLDFLALERSARVVLTDSGGVQQETSILGVPCLTLRSTTEWIETVEQGQTRLVGIDPERIVSEVRAIVSDAGLRQRMTSCMSPFQPGAARQVIDLLTDRAA